jgi:putative sigma-54 modulation protein
MIVTITGKHIEITDAIRAHAEEKVEKLPRYYDSITQIEVVLEGNEGGAQCVEILVHAEHNDLLIAKETGTDTYTCIDAAVHKMERQLRKAKEKQRGRLKIRHNFQKKVLRNPNDSNGSIVSLSRQ